MNIVWFGLGSNMGDRAAYIQYAVNCLKERFHVLCCSSLYISEPRDYTEQRNFLNMVVKAETEKSPREVLYSAWEVEKSGGRHRDATLPKGPRTLDIDLLLWNDAVIDLDTLLHIPHPRMEQRLFVLKPLLEIDPYLVHPKDGIAWHRKASLLTDQSVKLYRNE